jgi:hypothetical protein
MGQNFDIKGNMPELWVISATLFTNVLLIVTMDLLIYTKYHTWINFLILGVVTFIAYIAFIFAVHHLTLFHSVGTMMNTFSSYKIWIMFIFVCGTCSLIDFTILAFNYSFNRTITTLLQLQFNSIGKLNDEEEVPDEVKEKLKIYNQYEDNKNEDDDDDKKENKDKDVSKSRTDFSNNNLLRTRDPSFFRKSNLKDVEKSSASDRSSFRLDNNTDRERRLTSGSENSERKNNNSSSVSSNNSNSSNSNSSNTDKSRNKKNKLKNKKNIKNNTNNNINNNKVPKNNKKGPSNNIKNKK